MFLWIIVGHSDLGLEVILSPGDVDRHGGGLLRQLELVARLRVQEGAHRRDLVRAADEGVLLQKLVDKPGENTCKILSNYQSSTCSLNDAKAVRLPLELLGLLLRHLDEAVEQLLPDRLALELDEDVVRRVVARVRHADGQLLETAFPE